MKKQCRYCKKKKTQEEFKLHKDWCRECIYDHDLLDLVTDASIYKQPKAKVEPTEEQRAKARMYREKYKTTPKAKYSKYKSRAKRRDIPFTLSVENFISLDDARCEYCHCTEKLGYDRVNSTRGYTADNVVPCCKTCNMMKNDLSVDEFLGHIERISNVRK